LLLFVVIQRFKIDVYFTSFLHELYLESATTKHHSLESEVNTETYMKGNHAVNV